MMRNNSGVRSILVQHRHTAGAKSVDKIGVSKHKQSDSLSKHNYGNKAAGETFAQKVSDEQREQKSRNSKHNTDE